MGMTSAEANTAQSRTHSIFIATVMAVEVYVSLSECSSEGKVGCVDVTNGSPCFILSEPLNPSFLQSLPVPPPKEE